MTGNTARDSLRVLEQVYGVGPIRRPELVSLSPGALPDPTGTRQVCFDAALGYAETPIYWRPDLSPGNRIEGPAIIEEYGSTVPLHPGFTAVVDSYGNLVITK